MSSLVTYFEYIGHSGKRLPDGYWKKKEHQNNCMDWLGKKLGYTTMDDWYQISYENTKLYASRLLSYYNNSPCKMVMSIYPNHNWLIWKFKMVPQGTWKKKKVQKAYMDWLGKKLGYTTMDDWYKITSQDILNNYGYQCRKQFENSQTKMIMSIYPNHNWFIWKFSQVPKKEWKKKEFQKAYMDWLGKELGYTTMDDWYKISGPDIINNYGSTLLCTYYNSSPVKIVMSIYSNHNWFIWKFKIVPNNNWKKKKFQKDYMDWLGKELGYTTMDDWYKITSQDIVNNYGRNLFHYYSLIKLVTSVYPNYNWFIWMFECKMEKDEWKKEKTQKDYMNWLGKKLGYTTMEDWYKIYFSDFKNNYGSTLLHMYNGIYKLLKRIFPDYNWLLWKFNKVGNEVWKKKKNHKEYIEWLGKELRYTTMDDWYKINQKDIYNNYGAGLLTKCYNGSPSQFVTKMYPNHKWDIGKFNYNKTEGLIHDFLLNNKCNIGIKIIIEQYIPKWNNKKYRYDFYIELANGKKIIIECDGEYHYTEIPHFYRNDRTLEKQQDRDILKMQKALDNNCSIIRAHQEEVWHDKINWKKEITNAINEIKNENEVSIKLLGCLKNIVPWELE